jgi:sugar-specific transcriptional regulator TrmB
MDQNHYGDSVRHLSALGFTEIEALVYSCLVERSSATGYQIARAIGKAVANTYKALHSLQEKGAVVIDTTGESRACRAVPSAELLERLRNRFEKEHAAAAVALASLHAAEPAGGVYSLTSVEQVFDRFALLVDKAEDIVLLDAFPAVIRRVAPILERAAARGVIVVVQVYEEVTLKGVDTILATTAADTLRRWADEWTCLIVDGSEYLFAYIGRDGTTVRQAIWSDTAFISWVQYSYLGNALRGQVLEQAVMRGASRRGLEAALARTERWSGLNVRGYRELMARFGESERPRRRSRRPAGSRLRGGAKTF